MSRVPDGDDVAMRFPLASVQGNSTTLYLKTRFPLSAGECVGSSGQTVWANQPAARHGKILAPSAGKVEWATGVSNSLLSSGLGFDLISPVENAACESAAGYE